MREIYPTSLTLIDVITLIIFDEDYKLWSVSLRSFLHDPATFTLPPSSKYSP
jgi:hypothetical protein